MKNLSLSRNRSGFTLLEIMIVIVMLGVISGILMYTIGPVSLGNSNKSAKYAFFGCVSVTLPVGVADVAKCEYETFDPKGLSGSVTNTLDVGYKRKENPLGLETGRKYPVSGGSVVETDSGGKITKILSLPF